MHVSPAVRCARQKKKKKKIINVSLGEGWSPQDLSSDRWETVHIVLDLA
jgi:hypothetical protein